MHNNNMQNNQRNLTSAEREMLRKIAKIAPNFPVMTRYERKKRFGTHRSINPTILDNLRSIMEREELNFSLLFRGLRGYLQKIQVAPARGRY